MEQPFDLSNFLDALASGQPTPGGGSAAALAGALGAALAAMVARLTAGRKRYAAVDAQMQDIILQADRLRARLTALVAADAAAYEQVRAAYRLPRDTAEDQARRQAAIQTALQTASRTPLETVAACLAVLRLARQVVEAGNPHAATDGSVGALLAHAGLRGAALNVRVNLIDIEDQQFVSDSEAAIAQALSEAQMLADQVAASVEQRL